MRQRGEATVKGKKAPFAMAVVSYAVLANVSSICHPGHSALIFGQPLFWMFP